LASVAEMLFFSPSASSTAINSRRSSETLAKSGAYGAVVAVRDGLAEIVCRETIAAMLP
jgi:hypothetical protein